MANADGRRWRREKELTTDRASDSHMDADARRVMRRRTAKVPSLRTGRRGCGDEAEDASDAVDGSVADDLREARLLTDLGLGDGGALEKKLVLVDLLGERGMDEDPPRA